MTQPSTEPVQPTESTEPTGATPPAPEAKPEDALQDPGKKALAEERAARKAAEKERAALEARLKEFEDRDKTEAQKLAERAEKAEKAAAGRDAELLRLRTALKHGISDEDAETFLTGADEETLTRQAERLVALQGSAGPRTPAPDPSQGSRGGNLPDTDALIREAQAKGDWRTVISLQNEKLTKTN